MNFQKYSREPLAGMLKNSVTPNDTIFSIKHPVHQEIQVCSNQVYWVTNGHALRGCIFFRFI